jgi:2-dehydro-3-deoxyphosphogluconate aldolase/(4S)-4-hydroxy-2-oxoglutarate aldolase
METMKSLERILDGRVIAIIRASFPIDVLQVARALMEGGIRVIEVSFNSPGAAELIRKVTDEFGDELCCGAGTVVDAFTAMRAIESGSRFVISPIADEAMIRACVSNGIPAIPGAFTPAEIHGAFAFGASMVKVFPAEPSGPEYLKAIKAVFPQIPMVAVGGIDAVNARHYLSKGACAVAVGSSIVNDSLMKAGAYEQIRKNARHMMDSIAL